MDPVWCVLQSRRFREVGNGAFGRAVGGDHRLTDEAVDGGEIDDPAAVAGGVGWLVEELSGRVFRAEPDAADVDGHGSVEDVDRCLVNPTARLHGCGFGGDS